MVQLTLRVSEQLARHLKEVAAERDESVNAYAGRVLAAAVDPESSGSDAESLRMRLARAGLLAGGIASRVRVPDESTVAAARVEAGSGRPLSELVHEGRHRASSPTRRRW